MWSCLLHNPETSPLQQTGFVYSSTEALDVSVCRHHVSSEAERGVPPVMRQMTSSIGMNSRLHVSDRWQANTVALFAFKLSSNTSRHTRSVLACDATRPVWQHVWWCCSFNYRQIPKHMLLLRGGQPAKQVLLCQAGRDDCMLSLCPPLHTGSASSSETLCYLFSLTLHCWSVH